LIMPGLGLFMEEDAPRASRAVNLVERAQRSRKAIVAEMRTSATVEMKKAESERVAMQQIMQETTSLQTQLMHRKYEDIIKDVVAPERRRALLETEELAGTTLSADTLPKGEPLANTKLTEKDHHAINQIVHSMQAEETARAAEELSKCEMQASLEIHEFADEATNWATDRQDACQRRQELFNSRMQLPVKHAVEKLDALALPAEKVEALDIPREDTDVFSFSQLESQPLSPHSPRSRKGVGPMQQPNLWNADVHTPSGVQPVLKNSVIGTVMVDIGKACPIRLRVYGGDDPKQAAADFCTTYRKGARARKMLLAAIHESIQYSETQNEERDEEWLVLSDLNQVSIDLRRV